jgi:hypothetical protein
LNSKSEDGKYLSRLISQFYLITQILRSDGDCQTTLLNIRHKVIQS